MSDNFIGNNMAQGSADRSMTQMGWVMSDAQIEKRTLSDQRTKDSPYFGEVDVAGLWSLRPGQVLARSLDTRDHVPDKHLSHSMIRGRNKVWAHLNGLSSEHAFGFAGVAATAHNGADPNLADQKVSVIQSGAVTITSNLKEDADTGDVVLVDLASKDEKTQTFSSAFPGDERGVCPLQLKLAKDAGSTRFVVANALSSRLVDILPREGTFYSSGPADEKLGKLLDAFEAEACDMAATYESKQSLFFHQGAEYHQPSFFRVLQSSSPSSAIDLIHGCNEFTKEIEASMLVCPSNRVCTLYTLAMSILQLSILNSGGASMSGDDCRAKLMPCSTILMYKACEHMYRHANRQYSHIVGTVLAPASAGESLDVLIR